MTTAREMLNAAERPLLGAYWNWKTALLSAACRGVVFFVASVPEGWATALSALNIEFVYRALISGWFGALTERAGRPSGARHAFALLVAATVVAHVIEWQLHVAAKTPHLAVGLAASVALSVVSTAFTLFAMSRGTLLSGHGRRSLGHDMRAMPALIAEFVRAAVGRRSRV